MSKKLTIDYVREYMKSFKYVLLSNEYVDAHTKLRIKCDKGHTYPVKWSDFQTGCRCPKCDKDKRWGSIEKVREYLDNIKYVLLSTTYINNKTKLKVKCNKGHIYFPTWRDTYAGSRCPECFKESKKTNINYIRGYMASFGCTLLSNTYTSLSTKLKIKNCEEHEYIATWREFKAGCRLLRRVTKGEFALYEAYANRIDWREEIRQKGEYLQVKCTNCNEWFTPKYKAVNSRVASLNNNIDGYRFYCSDECKYSCPIFGKREWPEGFKKYQRHPDYAVWAKMIKERDNYECQICGETEGVNAHHYEGLNVNDMQSLDLDMGVTLCAECHHRSHTGSGCTYYDLQKRNICNGESNGKREEERRGDPLS